jgi:hypothetical protein
VHRAEGVILAALLAIFICRAVVANAIVPPWQGPDEPAHFALAYGLSMASNREDQIRTEVLQSMVHHRWWALYDDPPPQPLTEAAYSLGWGTLNQPLYYGLAAVSLNVSRPADLETAYYHLRALGVLLAITTLAFGWAGIRVLFGSEVAAGATAIGALHPQFLLAAISVNADALVNVCGAFVWWQAARAITGHRRALSIVLMLVGAGAALFTKRIGMILVGVAVIVTVASLMTGRTRRTTRREALLIAVIGAVSAVVLAGLALLFREQADKLWQYWGNVVNPDRSLEEAIAAEGLRFGRMTVDYFWLIAGWLRFQPPRPWLWVARILIVAGMTGAVFGLVKPRIGRAQLSVAWLFVIAQLMAMLATVLWLDPSAPQARYLFPVFVPITVLLYVGLRRMVPPSVESHWTVALVVVLLALDMTGFTTVLIPAYVP